jgi:hypothetical protein
MEAKMMSRIAGLGGIAFVWGLSAMPTAIAASAGQVMHLSGTLSVTRADGSSRILSRRSYVNSGDVLATQRDSYAQINFTDGSTLTLRPRTRMKVENYEFTKERPQADNSFFRLLRGGLRMITGLIGKRGNKDAYRIGTSTMTIGIRGTSGDTLDCTEDCEGVMLDSEKLPKAVYQATYTGSFILTNESGSVETSENQFHAVAEVNGPIEVLPNDPGFRNDPLPFAVPGGGPQRAGGQECVVR